MKQILDSIRRNTGLTQAESVVVATIAALLFTGWIGRSLFEPPRTHHVESAERVIALLDSLVAQQPFTELQSARADAGPRLRTNDKPAPSAGPRTRSTEIVHPISINRATAQQLTALPGVGPTTAARIIEARAERPFDGVDDLLRVKGIGPKKLERMRPFISAP